MTKDRQDWVKARNELVAAIKALGFPEELGNAVAKNLGSPKAMSRMTSYLHYVKPKKAELIVDEMLGIMSEIDAWKDKKESERANARYNEIINYGLENGEEGDLFEEENDLY